MDPLHTTRVSSLAFIGLMGLGGAGEMCGSQGGGLGFRVEGLGFRV